MKKLFKITFVSLCFVALLLAGCGPDETVTPKVDPDPVDSTSKIEEYIEVNGVRLNSDEFGHPFAERKFSTQGLPTPDLSVVFEKDGIAATDFRWNADSTMFREGNYIPTFFGLDTTYFGFSLVGYTSGTGKFGAENIDKTEFDKCELKKKNGKWYVEVENLLMTDGQDNFADIRVSARLVWQDYTE
jgi:hypothetical protein